MNIKSIDLLMNPNNIESCAVTTWLFLETLVPIILRIELYFLGKGDRSTIKNQAIIELSTYLIPVSALYIAASFFIRIQ